MSDSRQKILARLRAGKVDDAQLPDLDALANDSIRYQDLSAAFAEQVAAVGGSCQQVADHQQAAQIIRQLPVVQESGGLEQVNVCSLAPELQLGGLSLDEVDDPHDVENVFLTVVGGEFGVAENGAVWITDAELRQRSVLFLTQHLVILLPAAELVHNMHQAYQRLSWGRREFGVFISGPSKTADIEQSLVIGAHGPRSLTVLLV